MIYKCEKCGKDVDGDINHDGCVETNQPKEVSLPGIREFQESREEIPVQVYDRIFNIERRFVDLDTGKIIIPKFRRCVCMNKCGFMDCLSRQDKNVSGEDVLCQFSKRPEDSFVNKVVKKYQQRSIGGFKKYKTGLDREDLSTLEWINHVQDELMDATNYLERLKVESVKLKNSKLKIESLELAMLAQVKTIAKLEKELIDARSIHITSSQESFQDLINICHGASTKSGWWTDLETGEDLRDPKLIPERLCLIHSEISEAMEAHRKDLKDDKLPHRSGIEVELADGVIRICDLAGAFNLDLGGAIFEKIEYNANRADHKIENRKAPGGKTY